MEQHSGSGSTTAAADLPRLAAQLNAADEADRLRAAVALGGLRTPEALAILAARLEVPDTWPVVEAVMGALVSAGPAAKSTLERLCERSESSDARGRLQQVLQVLESTGEAGAATTGHAGSRQSAAAARPGRRPRSSTRLDPVPWGPRDSLLGVVVAQFPEIVPALLAMLAGVTAASSAPTDARAIAAVVGTLVFDSWWIVWAWVFSLRKLHLGPSAWGFRRPRLSILWLVPLALAATIVVDVVYGSFVSLPQSGAMSRFPHTAAGLVLLVIGACVLAPLFEETFFRGFLFQGFASWRGAFWGAAISSALWSAGHFEPALFAPLFVDGLILCWVFRRNGSIWANIATHAAINVLAVLSWVH